MRMAITDSVPLAASMLLVTVALASCGGTSQDDTASGGSGVSIGGLTSAGTMMSATDSAASGSRRLVRVDA